MKITEDVHKYTAEQGMSEEEALKHGKTVQKRGCGGFVDSAQSAQEFVPLLNAQKLRNNLRVLHGP